MDCKDLMIGDWVSLSNPADYGRQVRVQAILDKSIVCVNRRMMVTMGYVQPIPLTEEILVKNGWRKEPITIDGDYADWYGEIPICQEEDEFNYERIELTYVHQLQHLLRLCGIEKEIEL